MAADTVLVFNALSGPELLKVVLTDIEKKLLATGEFDAHVTFPWVKYNYQVGLVVYPKQAVDAEPGIKAAGEGEVDNKDPEVDKESAVSIEVEDTVIVDTPDLARIASNLPVPTPGRGPGNVLIDRMVTPAAPKSDKRPFGYKGTDGKGASGTGNQSTS